MDVEQVIVKYLTDNGYDGLCNPDSECGCPVSDIAPCCQNCMDCLPAHKTDNPPAGFDSFFISGKKDDQPK